MILKINDKMKVESNFSHHKHETGEKRHNVSRLNVGSASWRSVIHRTTDNIKKFVGNCLLTTLVVLQVELPEQFVGIIGSRLHGHHSCRMLGSIAVEQGRV